jgi:hypothetical protein
MLVFACLLTPTLCGLVLYLKFGWKECSLNNSADNQWGFGQCLVIVMTVAPFMSALEDFLSMFDHICVTWATLIQIVELKFPKQTLDSKENELVDQGTKSSVAEHEQQQKVAEEGRCRAIRSRAYTR